jgi:DNA-binding transcriptional LysR family regulator
VGADIATERRAAAEPNRATSAPGIEFRHFRYFLAVSDELHFGRAAERLHIAQPPLSQAIRKLEEALGVQLFERTSRAVALTDAGRVLTDQARKVLAAFDLALAETRRAGGAGATLRVGCVPHLPIERLLRFLNALAAADPQLRTRVVHMFTYEQVKLLRAGELDLALFDSAGEHPEVEVEPVFQGECMAVFLPPNHALASRDVLKPEDLRDETLVLFERDVNPVLFERLVELIEGQGYTFRAIQEADGKNVRDVMLAVAAGQGVAFGPFSFRELTEAGQSVVRRELAPPVRMPETVVAWRTHPPGQLAVVLATVREVARTLRKSEPDVFDIDR